MRDLQDIRELINPEGITDGKIVAAQARFYDYCKMMNPKFYRDDRPYQRDLCETLQAIFEGRLINKDTGEPYKNLMINLPPRHGKSYTLTLFVQYNLRGDRTMNRRFGQPRLPRGILHTLTEIRAPAPTYDVENGGQWVPGTPERIDFEGCVLPVSEDDWKTAADGTYTANSRKIYTNGHVLRIGGQVYDPQDGATYTVRGDLDHGVIHPLRRFVADRKGEAASK